MTDCLIRAQEELWSGQRWVGKKGPVETCQMLHILMGKELITYTTCFITRSCPVDMFHQAIQNSTNAKRWFNDIWRIFTNIFNTSPLLYSNEVFAKFNFAISDSSDIN